MEKLLIIDDDPDIGDLISEVARKAGYDSACATNFSDFRAKLSPDLSIIVLDLIMPGMDGIEVLRYLGEHKCQAGIVLISGMDWKILNVSENLAKELGLNVLGRMKKPISVGELASLLRIWKEPVPQDMQDGPNERHIEIAEGDIARAIEENRFVVHYLPRMDIKTQQPLGVEALVRWNHPTYGLVAPYHFIEKAEQQGLIEQLTWRVINKALSEMELLTKQGWSLSVSFNLSARSLSDIRMPEVLSGWVEVFKVKPENVIVEITEAGMLSELAKALDVLIRLRIKGFGISIDDFGGGHSVLQQLRRIPANELKIHKSFVADMLNDEFAMSMVRKTIELGHELGMKVLAEGVETKAQLDKLRELGCELAQGFVFGRPVSILRLSAWLQEWRATTHA